MKPPSYDPAYQIDLYLTIKATMKLLTPREEKILVLRYGLDGQPHRLLAEVGEALYLSPQRVVQIEAKALRKLARNLGLKVLKSRRLREWQRITDARRAAEKERDDAEWEAGHEERERCWRERFALTKNPPPSVVALGTAIDLSRLSGAGRAILSAYRACRDRELGEPEE